MVQIEATNRAGKITIEFAPSADFITCLIPALLSAVPAFLQSFMTCISGGGSGGNYNPGDRKRCN